MNKKLIGNLFLIALVVTLGLSFVDFGQNSLSHEALISDFIAENLEEGTRYQAISFQRIDENMLMKQPEVEKAYATIIDSISLQLDMLSNDYVSLDFQNSLQAANGYQPGINLENLADYLPLDAQLKRQLKNADAITEATKAALYEEEIRMHGAISDLNAALGRFNLSLFSLSLDEESNPIYWHEYELSDAAGRSQQESVFELDRESGTIVSFKEIENVG